MTPEMVSKSTLKKALLIKTLLQTSKFIILEDPNDQLDQCFIDNLKKALLFDLKSLNKAILIKTRDVNQFNDCQLSI